MKIAGRGLTEQRWAAPGFRLSWLRPASRGGARHGAARRIGARCGKAPLVAAERARGSAGHGMARLGNAGLGRSRPDGARLPFPGRGKAPFLRGESRLVTARPGMAWLDLAPLNRLARQGRSGQGISRLASAGLGLVRPGVARHGFPIREVAA